MRDSLVGQAASLAPSLSIVWLQLAETAPGVTQLTFCRERYAAAVAFTKISENISLFSCLSDLFINVANIILL